MTERRLHFEAAVPQKQLRQRRQSRGFSGLVVLAVLVLAAWNVSGISIAPGQLQYSAVGIGTGGETRLLVLTNRNSSDVHPRIQVLGEAASDFSFSSEACATIKGGEICRLPVHFRPHESGLKSAQLTISLDDGQSASAELIGQALRAEIEFLPKALDFHQVLVGVWSGEQRVRLSGAGDLRIVSASTQGEGSPDYHIGEPACTTNPDTGSECYISVSLRPRHEGETTANLIVRLEGQTESYTATLSGEGIPAARPVAVPTPIPTPTMTATPAPPPSVTPRVQPLPRPIMRVAPLEMDFSADPRRPQQVHVWNDGDAPLHIGALIAGPDTPRFQAPTQPCVEIPPHGECAIPVRFQPAPGKPEYMAVLRLNHTASNIGSPQEVVLHWRSQQPTPPKPEEQGVTVDVQPGSLNFSGETNGRTAVSLPSQPITIRNSGSGSVQNLNLRLGMFGGAENKYFRHSSNCRTLGPGQACQETVSFVAVAATAYQEKLYVMDGLLKVLAVVQLSATLSGPPPQPNRTPATGTLDTYRPPGPGPSIDHVAAPASPTPSGQIQRIESVRKMVRPTPTPTPTPTPDIR